MKTRKAVLEDAVPMSEMLMALTQVGKRSLPSDPDFVRNSYIAHPDAIQCTLAVDDVGQILGLQILKRAAEGNPYGVTPGWGIIGTHVHPDAARRGVGKALIAATREAAQAAGLQNIDATIGKTNDEGLGYYTAMGFEDYKTGEHTISKCLKLA
jgi:ribosomal protein S18 acetylase RimI-like enzyme